MYGLMRLVAKRRSKTSVSANPDTGNMGLCEWRSIAGFEGQYEVSDTGLVRSLPRRRYDGNRVPGCILKPATDRKGYLGVNLTKNAKGHPFRVHRLVAKAFVTRGSGDHVNHIDGNKKNNAASNLEWCSPLENSRHALDTGLFRLGERASNAVMTEMAALYILASKKLGVKCCILHKLMPYKKTTIEGVYYGHSWKHLRV